MIADRKAPWLPSCLAAVRAILAAHDPQDRRALLFVLSASPALASTITAAGPAFTSLRVKPKQTGTKIAGSLKVAAAGATLKLTLQIPAASAASSKSSKKKPVTIGTATIEKLKSGKRTFAVKLDSRGLKAQKKHRALKVTLSVSVTPPGGSATTASKGVTLTRAAAKKH